MTTSQFRTRQRGAFSKLYPAEVFISKNGTSSTTNRVIPNANGTVEEMSDFVTKPFVPGREIVNSPMRRYTHTRSQTTQTGYQDYHKSGYIPDTAIVRIEGARLFGPFDSIFDAELAKLKQADQAVISLACTKALASVRPPEVAGLVSLAEMRSTIQGLLNPVQGALRFLSRNAPSRKRKSKRRLSKASLVASSKDLANQHLSIVFGLLPFISDIQGILKALAAIEPVPIRRTARGEASYVDSSTTSTYFQTYSDSKTESYATQDITVQKTVSVRAFQLYEASVSLNTALGLSLSDIPKAVWQTTTLSFVVDWFANVGDFISALTPQEGVTYVTSGYTITTVTACHATYVDDVRAKAGVTDDYWTGRWQGNAQRVVVAKQRVPTSLSQHIGLHLKSNMHKDTLDTFKVAAGISLITQRLRAYK